MSNSRRARRAVQSQRGDTRMQSSGVRKRALRIQRRINGLMPELQAKHGCTPGQQCGVCRQTAIDLITIEGGY